MVATMLHSVATGNILPASIPLVCVDINPATVTKLADRGSSQARGIVTDVGLFLEQLAVELVPPSYRRGSVKPSAERQVGGADRAGLRAEGGAQRRAAPTRWPAPTSDRRQRAPGGLEQQVAGGGDAAADDDELGVERRDEVGQPDAQPVARPRRRPAARPDRPPRRRIGDHRAGELLGVAAAELLPGPSAAGRSAARA